jgi:hypothetical protein
LDPSTFKSYTSGRSSNENLQTSTLVYVDSSRKVNGMKFWMSTLAPTSRNHFSQNAHTETTDNGKVRPYHHDNMVLFICCCFVHHTHLMLDLFAAHFGWLSHGKWFKLVVESILLDVDDGDLTLRSCSLFLSLRGFRGAGWICKYCRSPRHCV